MQAEPTPLSDWGTPPPLLGEYGGVWVGGLVGQLGLVGGLASPEAPESPLSYMDHFGIGTPRGGMSQVSAITKPPHSGKKSDSFQACMDRVGRRQPYGTRGPLVCCW